jgi:hypothetical protein
VEVSSAREILAARRQVLVARASLQRLEVRHELGSLRESLRWPRLAASIGASSRGRSALFGLVLLAAGRRRLARLLGAAAAGLVLAKLAIAMAKSPSPPDDSKGG